MLESSCNDEIPELNEPARHALRGCQSQRIPCLGRTESVMQSMMCPCLLGVNMA